MNAHEQRNFCTSGVVAHAVFCMRGTHPWLALCRYADVMVHRLLAASMQLEELPEASRDRERLRSLADTLNTRHRNAQLAGRASAELHTLIFFKGRTVLADARITKVHRNAGRPCCEFRFDFGSQAREWHDSDALGTRSSQLYMHQELAAFEGLNSNLY